MFSAWDSHGMHPRLKGVGDSEFYFVVPKFTVYLPDDPAQQLIKIKSNDAI